ncbi:hypothetical protein EDC96DRAFT_493510 [Choanephora cucurbitarum]|nr:hypothetical protein EDC96DRAFT_493510 [Choanephora cucurbitarum]
MLLKNIPVLLLAAASTVLACEMDCRRGVSKGFAHFYGPVIEESVNNLQLKLTDATSKVSVPSIITQNIDGSEVTSDLENSIKYSLDNFTTMATADSRLAEGFYQVIFNEELPYKGDCNNPKRLTRKMPPPGESWTMDECRKMDYRCGNPPSICYALEDVKQRCIGRMRRQMIDYSSPETGALVRSLVLGVRKSVRGSLQKGAAGKLIDNAEVGNYITKLVAVINRDLSDWVNEDVRQLCDKPSQKELCNSWDDEIRKEILRWP